GVLPAVRTAVRTAVPLALARVPADLGGGEAEVDGHGFGLHANPVLLVAVLVGPGVGFDAPLDHDRRTDAQRVDDVAGQPIPAVDVEVRGFAALPALVRAPAPRGADDELRDVPA